MNRGALAMIVTTALCAAACATPDADRVRATADAIVAADNARDLDRVLDCYAAGAILLPPDSAPVVGKDAIRPRYESLFDGFDPAIEPRIDELRVDGDRAFVRGRNGGVLHARGAGTDRVLDDVYLMLLAREADGSWRITHLMWHRAAAATTER